MPEDHTARVPSQAGRPGDRSSAEATSASRGSVAVMSALMALASISTDIYLPAMPVLGRALGAGKGTAELTLSSFLVGFSLGQLLWGPIGDRYGRRHPILIGLLLFVVGSIGCAMASTMGQLIAWRVVQAIGACAGPVLARAMARDIFGREGAARLLSTLMLVMGVAPLLGPMIGGQMLLFASWRSIFWLLAGVGILLAAAVTTLPETLPYHRRSRAPLSSSFTDYLMLAGNPTVMGYALASGCYYAGIYAYLAGTPFAYIEYYHVSVQAYGLVLATGIFGQMLLNMVNRRYVVIMGPDRMLRCGVMLVAVSAVLTGMAAVTGLGGLWGLVIPLAFFMAANGLFIANAVSGALEVYPGMAGSASALVGSIQFGSGIFGAGLIGWLANGTPGPMGMVIAGLGIASPLALTVLVKGFWQKVGIGPN